MENEDDETHLTDRHAPRIGVHHIQGHALVLETGLIWSRFFHFLAVLSLFGTALFPLYTFRHAVGSLAADEPRLARQLRLILSLSLIIVLMSGIGWFVFTAGAIAGDLSQAFDSDVLKAIIQGTEFGPLWILRLVLLVLVAAFLVRWPLHPALWATPVLAGLLLASLAGTGHAWGAEGWGGYIHTASDCAHLLMAGVWLGGLWPLGLLIAASRDHSRGPEGRLMIGDVLTRFSGVGTIAVVVLVLSGIINSWFLVRTLAALFSTTYGRFLLLKIAIFLFMALLASANRFWLTPKLRVLPRSEIWLARLRLHVFGEQALGAIVVGLVSLLGTLEPAAAY